VNIIIGLIAELLLWEVLHNCEGRSFLTAIFSRLFEVEVRVLLLSLDHLYVASHVVVLFLLHEVLPDDQRSWVLIVVFKRRGQWCIWIHWFCLVHLWMILNKINANNATLVYLLLREVLNDSQSSLLVFIFQFIKFKSSFFWLCRSINSCLFAILNEDEVLLLILLSWLLELDERLRRWNCSLKHDKAGAEQIRWEVATETTRLNCIGSEQNN